MISTIEYYKMFPHHTCITGVTKNPRKREREETARPISPPIARFGKKYKSIKTHPATPSPSTPRPSQSPGINTTPGPSTAQEETKTLMTPTPVKSPVNVLADYEEGEDTPRAGEILSQLRRLAQQSESPSERDISLENLGITQEEINLLDEDVNMNEN